MPSAQVVRGQSPSPLTGMFFFGLYHHVRQGVCGGNYVRGQSPSPLLGGGIFFSTTTYGGAYVVVIMCVRVFVCPRNYLNNVQEIINVHFCQLRLVVSFNNVLYT